MKRGTTPELVFGNLDVNLTGAEKIYITLKQGDVELEKTMEDCTIEETSVTVKLTQAETLMFKSGVIKLQMRAIVDEMAVATDIKTIIVDDILKDGEI